MSDFAAQMVCSICHGKQGKPGHNARTCPKLELGAGKMAGQLVAGAGVGAGVGALTAVCPPAGAVVGGALLLKSAWDAGALAIQGSKAKTQAEKTNIAKKAMIAILGEGL